MSLLRAFGEWLIPVVRAQGQAFGSFTVTTWGYGDRTWQNILVNIVTMLKNTIVMVAVAVFVTGAFLFAVSAGDEKYKSRGKDMMTGALWALGIVLGAQAILRTASYFIWG